jgi:hypothetical protein
MVKYLGGDVQNFRFRKPGAVHHARFMSQSIYLLKMELLSNLFSMSSEERRIVHRMADHFTVLCQTIPSFQNICICSKR